MALTLHFHPLSSFCHKVLIGLYELDVPFEKHLLDLADPAVREAFAKLSPIGKMPVLQDDARGATVVESSIILEYLDRRVAKTPRLLPSDLDHALECRLQDRFFDMYVHLPMQRIVADRLRPADRKDPFGVDEAKSLVSKSYAIADDRFRTRTWALGDDFTMADCSAAPALFYASKLVPLDAHPHLAAYFARLKERPSYARVLEEAQPYFDMFPG